MDNNNPKLLEDFLNLQVVDDLKKLTKLVFFEGKLPTRKADIIAIITHELTTNLRDYWNALDDIQQKAVAETIYAKQFDATGFRLKYNQEPNWGEQNQWSSRIVTPSLLNLFILPKGYNYHIGYQRVVPEDLKTALKEWVPKPKPAQISLLENRPTSVTLKGYTFNQKTYEREDVSVEYPLYHADTEQVAQTDLLSVLRLIEIGNIRISDKTGFPTKNSLQSITEILQMGDFYSDQELENTSTEDSIGAIKAFAWPVLIHAAKLARSKSGKLELTPKGRKALTQPTHETIKIIWQSWLTHTKFDELRRINAIKGQTGKGKRGLTPPSTRRDTIVQVIKKCPIGSWFEFEGFFNFMRILGHILRVSEDPWELYIDEKYYGNLGDNIGVLNLCYTLVFLFEYAATLGLIDITYKRVII